MKLLHDTLIKWTRITTKYLFEDVQLFKLHDILIKWTGIITKYLFADVQSHFIW